MLLIRHYWRASVASETLTGVTQSKIGDVSLLASETLTGVTQSKIGDVSLFIQRASEASEADSQSCSIEISDIYIYVNPAARTLKTP